MTFDVRAIAITVFIHFCVTIAPAYCWCPNNFGRNLCDAAAKASGPDRNNERSSGAYQRERSHVSHRGKISETKARGAALAKIQRQAEIERARKRVAALAAANERRKYRITRRREEEAKKAAESRNTESDDAQHVKGDVSVPAKASVAPAPVNSPPPISGEIKQTEAQTPLPEAAQADVSGVDKRGGRAVSTPPAQPASPLENAKPLFEYSTEATADPAEAALRAARVMFGKGKMFNALAKISEVLTVAPANEDALTLKAEILTELGKIDEATSILNGLVDSKGARPSALFNRGLFFEKIGKVAEAISDYEAALKGGEAEKDPREVSAQDAALGQLAALRETLQRQAAANRPQEQRIALVIANGAYKAAPPLNNPAKDAKAVANTLRNLGFSEVTEVYDAGLAAFSVALREFAERAAMADWAMIYYSGHGIQVEGQNYLIPVDAQLNRAAYVDEEAISLERVLSKVRDARKLRLIILDACRNNPFTGTMAVAANQATRRIVRGLGRIEPPSGVMVAFAARDGQVAFDGDGENSPFARALVKHMNEPGIDIRLMLSKVRDTVLKETGNQQEPYIYGSLPGEAFIIRTR